MLSQCLKPACWLLLGWLSTSIAQATVFPLPPPDTDVIGQVKVVYATKTDTLIDIARRHSLGYDEIVHANPGVDRWAPGEGTPIVLPTRYILPDTPREGIVLNIAELRLYYYPSAGEGEQRVVYTYPVSIGRMDWKTPLGVTRVTSKETDPAWRPPASIKAEHAAQGDILPDVVPGGEDNPLGRHALRLALPSYLIHGTNRPYGIGMRVTHGCVRMYPEDIERLFGMAPTGTPVRIIDQPVKVGRFNGAWFMEVHEPLEEDNIPIKVTMEQVDQAVIAKTGPDMPGVDQAALRAAMEPVSGIPVSIAALAPPGSTPSEPLAGPSAATPRVENPAPPSGYPAPYQAPLPVRTRPDVDAPLVYDDDNAPYDDGQVSVEARTKLPLVYDDDNLPYEVYQTPIETRPDAPLVYDDDSLPYDDQLPVETQSTYQSGYSRPYSNDRTSVSPTAPYSAYPASAEPPLNSPPVYRYRTYPPPSSTVPNQAADPAIPSTRPSTSRRLPTHSSEIPAANRM